VPSFTVAVDGGELAARREGSGVPALLLHGGPGLSDYTEGLAAELRAHVDVTRYQQRGVTPSTEAGPFTVEQHVDDAVAVLDASELESAWIVGHSWGGHLAMHIVVAHPERSLGAVVIDPLGAVPDGGAQELDDNLTSRLPPELAERVSEIDRRAQAGEDVDATEVLGTVWPYYFAHPERAAPMPPMRISNACYGETLASINEHFERRTLVDGLSRSDVPMVFIHGRQSPIPPYRSEESAALAPRARVEIVDDAGHIIWLEQPGAIADIVAGELARSA
jgi:pimeloyl-ACP methyl ester carboxylesterase